MLKNGIDPRVERLLLQVLNPEDLGLATTALQRDAVRVALGRTPVESQLASYLPPAGTAAAVDVLAERARQQHGENYSPAHDDRYLTGTLARAAACYADVRLGRMTVYGRPMWPFDREYFKPRSARENYVRAAALLLAEIERMDRAGS